MSILPNMHVAVPCDSVETERATRHCLLDVDGPCYLRFAREATPIVTTARTPYVFGLANVIRFRGERPRFLDSFETFLGPHYENEREDAAVIACGPMLPEAMRAAWLLKVEYGIETRVVNVHTVKPLDIPTLVHAAEETELVVTAEEHQVGGFGNIVAGAILRHREDFRRPLRFGMVGVADRFGVSGKPWELVQTFGLTAEHIAQRVLELMAQMQTSIRRTAAQESVVKCARCHAAVPAVEIGLLADLPADELCADCADRARDVCAKCRVQWGRLNDHFFFLCRDCREITVVC